MAGNPFRSEAEAYRFLLLTVGYFALIVAAAAIATWLGLVVFVLLTAAVVVLWVRSRSNEPALRPAVPTHESAEDERHILVIANETVGGDELLAILREKVGRRERAGARRLPGAQLTGADLGVRRGRRAVGGAGSAGREPRAAAPGRRARAGARSATATRCRRSRTHSAPSAPTRS